MNVITFSVFNLVIHGYSLNRLIQEILTRASLGQQTWIVTANPEILLHAKKDSHYWDTIRHADIRSVDGFGLQLVGWFKGSKTSRVTGVDLADEIAKVCSRQNWTLVLVGGQNGAADKSAWMLRKRHPELKVFAEDGGQISIDGIADEEGEKAMTRIQEYEADVILAAFGHPKQEYWIARYRDRFPSAKLFIGVGGTFDFWSGNTKRAPKWMQTVGLEWLYRLITQPKRWPRIFSALIVFPIKALSSK
ncbi:MAG: WecB/TagA/CpsF family glycosyltransferase [Patescibacteria group bacterium]|nr:WecB/TagA/CpsF family glycosyltransferase [Patescibacteria group bacterium]